MNEQTEAERWKQAYRELEQTCEHWERLTLLHRSKSNGEYWAWQGDGSDHLESLACPVLIPAGELAKLLNERDTLKAAVDCGEPFDPNCDCRKCAIEARDKCGQQYADFIAELMDLPGLEHLSAIHSIVPKLKELLGHKPKVATSSAG